MGGRGRTGRGTAPGPGPLDLALPDEEAGGQTAAAVSFHISPQFHALIRNPKAGTEKTAVWHEVCPLAPHKKDPDFDLNHP